MKHNHKCLTPEKQTQLQLLVETTKWLSVRSMLPTLLGFFKSQKTRSVTVGLDLYELFCENQAVLRKPSCAIKWAQR